MEEQDIIQQHIMKRKKHKIKLAVESFILILIAVILILVSFILTKNQYNKFEEKANVDYKVNLKENEFYKEKQIENGVSVVASLIDNIDVEFKYNLNLAESQDYTYKYRIEAKTEVKDSNKKNVIFTDTEELLNRDIQESNSIKLEILENLNIDYNAYNKKISKFINVYNLDNTTSTLELSMYLDLVNKYDGESINKENKVVTLSIPLTTRTVDIGINSNVVDDEGKILSKTSEYQNLTFLMYIGAVILVLGCINLVRLIKYISETKSAEKMYDQELKKIIFNYKSYIQTIDKELDLSTYKIIQIKTFNEMLSLRETIQAPILMYTEEKIMRTTFTIIKEENAYVYVLGSREIREELRKKSAIKKAKQQEKDKKKEKNGKTSEN